jgi:hypothetical protein
MGSIKTSCENCSKEFDPRRNAASRRAITVAAAGSGAALGSGIGIAGGPLGAIAGTVPGGIAGAAAGHVIDSKWVTCPECDKTQIAY